MALPSPPSPIADSSVLLVQLTDSHLFANADEKLLGMSTFESLNKVIECVLAEQSQIDLLIASGDLSQDGSLESYQAFRQASGRIQAPARWFPGNHDEVPAMTEAARQSDFLAPIIDLGHWRITLLDSSVPGSVPGYLQDQQLQLLAQSLSEEPDRHHLVCLHHNPVNIGCAWMDPIGLRNPEALFAVLDRFPQVRAVLWGHVHQEYDQLRNGVRLLASPSTCIQFAPGSVEFKVDSTAPGYRWLRLHADGRLETGVSRVEGLAFDVDYSGRGY
ncbi:3',5'-cyclic-AMP phosphodiesterase [Pseudomonas sp. RTC3]|uniref:3',5'-cyclic-AMP phosphodiesterase n=1 Tax=unclassified Pseudomonas TaxID=196821 RepID=UPI002AB48CA3|nr:MULTISPECIES: 3',5'-cyclic-AMP phosphodiesterase [unclassified Pseudomonas]MEB0063958.1 3',5'-cyclic-AMP phosphodiesterase [Pseudomonas sp. RTC3]MDY7567748.1 3',5'-cyclic-AMP phosphodiesterase [Pseudomonas sp. 5C2]MEB0009238.1 3',5'-cyclic-AMP phosphodiesterase [Pseudomonas sp. RTB2]MEB0018171.1 3',5'-cyclic-AMP phosphodiesterase [Pseudomonas sp. RTB3]MEB0027066.1 3',5'-cyclic-AMP phosphodiesterase [Pseudomonas sp. MH9.2]